MNTIGCSSKEIEMRSYLLLQGADMTFRDGFAQALQSIRKAQGLTQEDFSSISSRTYLSALERGLKSPTLEKVNQLSDALGVHPLYLLSVAYLNAEQAGASGRLESIVDQAKLLGR